MDERGRVRLLPRRAPARAPGSGAPTRDPRLMRLSFCLSPEGIDPFVIRRAPPALSLNDVVAVAGLPWAERIDMVFS